MTTWDEVEGSWDEQQGTLDELGANQVQWPTPVLRVQAGLPIEVPIRLGPGGRLPTRAHPGDAGFDLYVSRATVIPANGFADVPSGVFIEWPSGIWGLITGRSSVVRTRRLLVTSGIIDQGWRGELFAGVQNLTGAAITVAKGERIAQVIPLPVLTDHWSWKQVTVLGESSRGTQGFGSSGT